MLTLSRISKSYPTKDVLVDVSWQVSPGERVGLVGPNGAGKSTLFRIVLGEVDADSGHVTAPAKDQIGHLAQELPAASDRTLQQEMWTAFAEVAEKQAELTQVAAELAAAPPDRLEALTRRQAALHDAFEHLGGYAAEAEIGKVLSGLGFREPDRGRPLREFSGGWRMRSALAKLLLAQPRLLLLDEPTNHLDVAAIEWLEGYLGEGRYKGALVVISHDRYFLDRMVTRISELDRGHLTDYATNYSGFVDLKAKALATQQAAYERQQKEIARQQAYIERFRASANRSSQAKSREKQLERVERIEAPTTGKEVRFRFAEGPPSGREVLVARGVTKAYGALPVLRELDLTLSRGDRLAVVGANGCGKSTLLRILAEAEAPDAGSLRWGVNLDRGVFAQDQADALDPAKTALQEVLDASQGWSLERLRTLLGRFLFTGEDVTKQVAMLSGGERARLALAKMLLTPRNFLLLDEPTNHLDLASKEVLAEALQGFGGTVVVVSHDRHFLDQVATRTLFLEEGHGEVLPGGYSAARATRLARTGVVVAAAPRPRAAAPEASPLAGVPGPAKKPTLSKFKRERLLEETEQQVVELEAEVAELEAALADPTSYAEGDGATALIARYEQAKEELSEANALWEELVEMAD